MAKWKISKIIIVNGVPVRFRRNKCFVKRVYAWLIKSQMQWQGVVNWEKDGGDGSLRHFVASDCANGFDKLFGRGKAEKIFGVNMISIGWLADFTEQIEPLMLEWTEEIKGVE